MRLTLRAEWTPFGGEDHDGESLKIAGLTAYVYNRDGWSNTWNTWVWEVEVNTGSLLMAGESPSLRGGRADSKAEAKDDAEAFIRTHLASQLVTR